MKKIILLLMICSIQCIYAAEEAPIPAQTQVCAACHGPTGNSVNPIWPNLSGQHVRYLEKQLHDFKAVTHRNAPTMIPMVANLSDEDMHQLAVFYNQQKPAEGVSDEKFVTRGEQLYRGGDLSKGISACIACHGPKGDGNGQAGFPSLSGQHAAYSIQQLQAFKDKKRSNDLNAIMRDISARMAPEDMEAVSNYIQGLH